MRHYLNILCIVGTKKNAYCVSRVSVSEKRSDSGVSSQLSIAHAERHDSGVYRCRAENAYGRDELLIYLAVQGNFTTSIR